MTLQERHNKAHKDLQKVAAPYVNSKEKHLKPYAMTIAKKLCISDQTIYNYIGGRCKDGFLTEAISEEFKKLTCIKGIKK